MAWTACRWCLDDSDVYIDLVRGHEADRYAVRRGSSVLSHDGEWEYEPMPSQRDDAFIARCRFGSFDAAAAAYARTVSS